MTTPFDDRLRAYAELTVKIGLNLQPRQRLLIIGPVANGGCSLEAAPLVRQITAAAYDAGARLVETLWGDEALLGARLSHAPRDSFDEFSAWMPRALVEHVEAGHAVLSIYANDPDQLKDYPPDFVAGRPADDRARASGRSASTSPATRPTGASSPRPRSAWAARVYPELPPAEQMPALWGAIELLCRLDRPDPIAAWETHLAELAARTDHLNAKQYTALRYTGPGTSLTIGLPPGHVWVGGRSTSASGIRFAPNLPTEEVFTMPHKDRVDGTVRSTKPLSYGGTLIEGFSLTFARRPRRRRQGREGRGRAAAAGEDGRRRGAPRRARAGAAQLAGGADRRAVLQHAVRRERREPRRARRRLQVHAARRRDDERRGVRGAPAATAARRTSTS